MALVRGGPAGPDGVGGAYQNEVETDRSAWWQALGGRQGVLRGLAISQVAGQMQLSLSAGSALLAERDASAGLLARGYFLWTDVATVVSFGAASPSARNDALVAAFVDTAAGPVGTGGLPVGAHLVVVPGVSGTTTARTDAQVTAFLGRGGWLRLANVPVAAGAAQIDVGGITTGAEALPSADSGNLNTPFFAAPGWSITKQSLRRIDRAFYFSVTATRTGAGIAHSGTGNIANTDVATWSAARYPILFDAPAANGEDGYLASGFARAVDATLIVSAVTPLAGNELSTGTGIQLSGHWIAG